MEASVSTQTPEGALAWEAEHRTAAAAASALAGFLLLGSAIFQGVAVPNGDFPHVGPLQALAPALQGRAEAAISPRTAIIEYYDDHAASLIASAVLTTIGTLLLVVVLRFLFRATQVRRAELPNVARPLVTYGPIAVAVTTLAAQVVRSIDVHHYVTGTDRTRDAADAALGSTPLLVISLIAVVAQLAMGLAFVLVAVNAMRAGLLTRFLGVLGIIVGALFGLVFFLPFGNPPVVQAFWLVALVPLFLGRLPSTPAAWSTGTAVPWPTQQELREARQEQDGGGKGNAAPLEPDAGDEPEPSLPTGSPSKKGRKRRR